MRIWLVLLVVALVACLAFAAGCGSASHKSSANSVKNGEAGITGNGLYVPGGTLYHLGKLQKERMTVEPGGLVGIDWNGGHFFFYHEGTDKTIQLTNDTAKQNLVRFVLNLYDYELHDGLLPSGKNEAELLDSTGGGLSLDFGKCSWWGTDQFDYDFSTGVGMNNLGGNTYSLTNCKMRWAAVQSETESAFLPAKNGVFETAVVDILVGIFQDAVFGQDTISAERAVRTYGAVEAINMYPEGLALNPGFLSSVEMAVTDNKLLFAEVNTADVVDWMIEVLSQLVGQLVPFGGCLNAEIDPLTAIFEADLYNALNGDAGANDAVLQGIENTGKDLSSCLIELGACVSSGPAAPICVVAEYALQLLTLLPWAADEEVKGFDTSTALAFQEMNVDDDFSPTDDDASPTDDDATDTFYDDFSDPNFGNWTLWGPPDSPDPVWVSSIFGRSGIFDNNGGPNCGSGAVTNSTFSGFGNGFDLEAAVYVDVTDKTGCWDEASIGIAAASADTCLNSTGWGSTDVGMSLHFDGDACWGTPPQYQEHAWFSCCIVTASGSECAPGNTLNGDSYTGQWVQLKIVGDSNGQVDFYANGNLIYSAPDPLSADFMSATRSVAVGVRSSGSAGKSYHDWVSLKINSGGVK